MIDHVLILDGGRLLRDCTFDELREEFVRVRITSLNGPFPRPVDIRGTVHCDQSDRQALVTMKSAWRDELDAAVESLRCETEVLPISFEDTYSLVVHGKLVREV